jgi:adenosylcobinamide-GDP ribazoletransferase
VRALVAAFGFLTRVPITRGPITDAELGRAVGYFPLVGAVLGLLLAGLGAGLARAALPPALAAVVLVAALALLTGGLHLDGLADLFDALGGGRGDRARMLEIMRDSRVGAHGAAALVLVLLAKTLAMAAALERRDLGAVVAFPAVARWAVTPAIAFFPYARAEGLGRAFSGQAGAWQVVGATVTAIAVLAGLGGRLILPALAALVVVLLLAVALGRRLGGLTGDAYGAAIELGEVTVLLGAALPH